MANIEIEIEIDPSSNTNDAKCMMTTNTKRKENYQKRYAEID